MAIDWVEALRRVDSSIDTKIDSCMSRVVESGDYLPQQPEPDAAIWRAFQLPLSRVRVLILGQDPYPHPQRAIGLSFSTGPSGDVPNSLANIFVELERAGYEVPSTGDLSPWVSEGALLLNRALTIPRDKQARPKRHLRWWSPVAISAMKALRTESERRPVAAMLWGVPAQRMRRHLEPSVKVFASSHPSPLSVEKMAGAEPAFRGSDPFTAVNDWFTVKGAEPIDWTLTD